MGAQWKAKGKDLAANAKGKMFTKLGQGNCRGRTQRG